MEIMIAWPQLMAPEAIWSTTSGQKAQFLRPSAAGLPQAGLAGAPAWHGRASASSPADSWPLSLVTRPIVPGISALRLLSFSVLGLASLSESGSAP